MIRKVRFPKISANVEEATVTAWLKQEGDRVAKGDLMLEITTDKGVVEVESPCAGTLRKVLATENSTLPVGYVVALVGNPDDVLPDVTADNQALLEQHRERVGKRTHPKRTARKGKRVRVRATPAARRLAREENVDLAEVSASLDADVINEAALRAYLEDGRNEA
jgi:pyruvate/2-oxoglutarate dehydrogenase complex dihydrolipoamide acyltransferase (E2) component